MLPTQNPDYVPQGLARLLTQYQGKPNLSAVVSAFLAEAQELEDAIWGVIRSQLLTRTIPAGPPDQALLQLADLVGCPTEGLTGPELAFLLQVWLLARRSHGLSEDLLAICAAAFPNGFTYSEFWPEAFAVTAYSIPDVNVLAGVGKALTLARPPEVAGIVGWGNWDATSTFYFGDGSPGGAPGSDFEESTVRGTYGTGFLSGIEV
jgi:hypothetical protein